jgi:hypothetical protein
MVKKIVKLSFDHFHFPIMRIHLPFCSLCFIWLLDAAFAFSTGNSAWTRVPPITTYGTLKSYQHPLQSRSRKAASGVESIICSTLVRDAYSGGGDNSEGQSYFQRKWSDFLYGADYVHSQYLELFWEYNFRRTIIPWVVPFLVLLAGTQFISPQAGSMTFDFLKYLCTGIFLVASAIGGLLTLPFDALRWTITLTPAIVIPMFDYLPSKAAIQLVKVLLDLHSAMNFLAQATVITGIAIVFWRPMIEEVQYRYLLTRLLGKGRKAKQQPETGDSENSSMVHFISVNGPMLDNDESSSKPETTRDPSSVKKPQSKSRRQLLSTVVFACTRLGWLCAHPETVDPSLPFLQTAISPYSWTVAFLQSAMAHFSSRVLSELSPLLQRSLLLLAIQQTVSTFFVTWYVFVPLYEERGIAASVGAHMAWTFGKMTWPIRFLWSAIARVSAAKSIAVPVPSSLQALFNRKR